MIDCTVRDRVTTIRMHRDPANVLDAEFCEAIETALRNALADDQVSAIVLAGTGGIFSAGVDLYRLLDGGDEYLTRFFAALNSLFDTAAAADKPMVAAVNGHAIAGGAILALTCDYRVMAAEGAKIGLPELQVGVPFPNSAISIVRSVVPPNHVREVVLLGRNFDAHSALERGLVDEVVSAEEVLGRSHTIAQELGRVPARSFMITKRLLRLPPGTDASDLDADVHAAWADPATHDHIRGFLERTLGKGSR